MIALIIVAGLLIVADVVAENVAEDRIQGRLASSIDGARDVSVEIKGRPFLLQVLQGDFQGLGVEIEQLRRRGITVQDVDLDLHDVSFSVRAVISGSGGISVEGGSGRAAIAEKALNVALARQGLQASVSLSRGGAAVSAQGMEVEAESVTVTGDALGFSAPPLPPIEITLPVFLEGLNYERARVARSKVLVFLDLPRTTLDPGSL